MFRRLRSVYYRGFSALTATAEGAMRSECARRKASYDNPIGRCSGKTFSQADEDGMISEILRRIGLARGTYCEFGVGNGAECNTLALAARGWRGFWISGEAICFSTADIDPQFFRFDRSWVDLDNVVQLFRRNADAMGIEQVDVLSFDLDSRDLFFLERLLGAGLRPAVAVVEYNAKFAPSIRWSVAPEDSAPWRGTDYFGASLASLAGLFGEFGYRLVACNPATGANAFFVRGDFSRSFDDVPDAIEELYVEPYFDVPRFGHPCDPRTVRRAFAIGEAIDRGEARPEFTSGIGTGERPTGGEQRWIS
ncbi:MAG TPA: hypothetical protein VFS49_13045 [Croceibacterium sp.]|nr:hypothetical protein [Croceibacterium sp.]